MKLKWISCILTCLICYKSYGQNRVGNGGDVVFCEKNITAKAQLLDFFEHNTSIDEENLIKDPIELALQKIQFLSDEAPQIYKMYKSKIESFKGDTDFKSNIVLVDINDSEHLLLDKNCVLRQAAIRKNKKMSSEKKYLIDKDLWDMLSVTHQAGLIMHEIIYDHYAQLGDLNSIKARQTVRFMFIRQSQKYWSHVKELRIPLYP